ncbi:MAG: sporulation protein YqfD [Clostridia bacterium]|nr:sporulation protein YqfD [Clostridia bacterium]
MRRQVRPWQRELTVEGLNASRFVSDAGKAGIPLTSVKRTSPGKLTALAEETQLAALEMIAVHGGWRLHIGRRKGLGRLVDWGRSRWLLAIVAAAGILALAAASRVMWRIEIVNAAVYSADVAAALHELGISPPMLRSQIDIGKIRDELEWRYPRVAWVEVGWRGTTLVVRLADGLMPDVHDDPADCDVVAARDGVVYQIVTHAGTPAVKVGDVVRKGDVLIRGEERTHDGAVRAVAARGSVTARVWQGAQVCLPAVEYKTSYTGREQITWTISTPFFDLWPMDPCTYEQYDTSVSETRLCSLFLPVNLHVERRIEAEISKTMRERTDVEKDAYSAAVRKLHEKIAPTESLIDIWGNCSMIEDEKVQAYAIGEMLVEIGVRSGASDMAAADAIH